MAKSKKPKFTFKREPRITGLASVGNPHQDVEIKHDGLVVGQISAPSWRSVGWRLGFAIGTKESWQWRFLKDRKETEEAARKWCQANAELVLSWGLYHFPKEDDE